MYLGGWFGTFWNLDYVATKSLSQILEEKMLSSQNREKVNWIDGSNLGSQAPIIQ